MYAQLRRRLDHKDDAGFTLIELLMVIVILAVLAAVVVFAVGGLNNTSKDSACSAQVTTINTAAEAYYAQNNAPVASIQALITGNFLHAPSGGATLTGNVLTYGNPAAYTVTFTPGAAGGNNAGNAVGVMAGGGAC